MALPDKVVLASGNAGKIREIARLLEPLGIEVVPQSAFAVGDVEETGTTFEANALLKARHAAEATGLPAIADDSGLAVDALDGRPGVFSARYAGPGADDDDNIDRLLGELEGSVDRAAAFHCVACYLAAPDATPVFAHGIWRGEILKARRGSGGFGYDPVFFDPTKRQSAAELDAAAKNDVSHRGQALRKLVEAIADAD